MVNFQREIRDGLEDIYPYSVSIADLESSSSSSTEEDSQQPAACDENEVYLYRLCLFTNCRDPSDPTCIIRDCVKVLSSFSKECKFCLVVQVGTSDGVGACAVKPAADYGRSFGLLLLSKKEIVSQRAEGYLGNVSEIRGYYQASVSLLILTLKSVSYSSYLPVADPGAQNNSPVSKQRIKCGQLKVSDENDPPL